jgi:PBSX family phage terminase large subunit
MTTYKANLSELIAPGFHQLYKKIKTTLPGELWLKGGRGSTKSSFIALKIMLLLSQDKNAHAFISRRYDNELRDTVYGQMMWAANKLNLDHVWRFMVSPMQAVNIVTGQKILFRGVDNPLKAKSINLGKGYIKVFWAEECDQYAGMPELRSIMQSVFRGQGGQQVAFFSFNPPKSARSWVNQEVKIPKDGRVVHHSDYRTVPVDWLGERFVADAEHLSKTNETAYRHEYLGEEVGTGLEVFNNVEIREIPDSEIIEFNYIRQGLDFGYAVDPVAFIRLHYDRKRRTVYLFREVSGIGIGNRALDARVNDEERRSGTLADREPKSIDELKDYDWRIRGAEKPPGSVDHGTKWLSELERIVIDPVRCPLASREFINYALELNRSGDIISRYPDKDNHILDATRYALSEDMREYRPSAYNVRTAARI